MLHQALGGDRRHHLASVVRPLAPAVAQREGEGVGEVRRTKDAASQQRLDDDHCGEIQEKRHGETCFEIVVGHCRIALPDEASGRYRRCVEGRPDLMRSDVAQVTFCGGARSKSAVHSCIAGRPLRVAGRFSAPNTRARQTERRPARMRVRSVGMNGARRGSCGEDGALKGRRRRVHRRERRGGREAEEVEGSTMGFRFSRRVSIIPGLRVNLSKLCASISIGTGAPGTCSGRMVAV